VTVPGDDPSVRDEDALLRRVPNRPRLLADDGKGGTRPSSAALELRDGEDGCSVDVRRLLPNPATPLTSLTGCPTGWGLATFTAADARHEAQHHVARAWLEDNPAHALVLPTAASRSARKRNFSRLARTMQWIQPPEME